MMKKYQLLWVVLAWLCSLASWSQPVCIAYCPYYRSLLPDPSIVTHINYSFAEVYVTGGEYKGFKLQGSESRFRQVVELKRQNPALKICLSFTHTVVNSDNKQDGGFSAIAASEDARRRFAADCLSFLQEWGIDGIDLDWEFPGLSWSGAASNPATDTPNYVLLMKQLRETLGNDYLLTYAGYVMDMRKSDNGYRYIDIAAVAPYVDFVNVMTYDMDAAPHYHSALVHEESYVDCKRAVDNYIKAGVPAHKLVLGIPFYLRHSFDGSTTAIDYRNLLLLARNANWQIDLWNDDARSPYATYKGAFYGSYDNPRSIAIKGEWVRSMGLRGMLYWDCGADDDARTLSRAVWNAVTGTDD
ncbi:MAG: glycoside hydrolase family 18 [Muribaculaceae bacterium]|nr:glycoside hydrolase family 18 [Muribaculaceae bacterium]